MKRIWSTYQTNQNIHTNIRINNLYSNDLKQSKKSHHICENFHNYVKLLLVVPHLFYSCFWRSGQLQRSLQINNYSFSALVVSEQCRHHKWSLTAFMRSLNKLFATKESLSFMRDVFPRFWWGLECCEDFLIFNLVDKSCFHEPCK